MKLTNKEKRDRAKKGAQLAGLGRCMRVPEDELPDDHERDVFIGEAFEGGDLEAYYDAYGNRSEEVERG